MLRHPGLARVGTTRRCWLPAGCSKRHLTVGPWINGQAEVNSSSAESISIENPATGESLGQLVLPQSEQCSRALQSASRVFSGGHGEWSSPSALHKRADVLHNLSDLLTAASADLALTETKQTGRSIREMTAQLGRVGEWFRYFAALIRTNEDSVMPVKGQLLNYVTRKPLGVVLQLCPWNHPLLIASKKIAPSLAAGNSVIVKPSELAPLTVLQLGKLAKEAGVPDGVLQILPGYGATTGKELVESPLVRKVDLTGGTATGRMVGALAGRNLVPFTAELGGKAPLIVFPDSPLDLSVAGASFAAFIASGQTCVSATRILVHSDVYDDFVSAFVKRTKSIEAHMALDPNTSMGSLISPAHLSTVDSFVQRAIQQDGLRLLTGGARMMGRSTTGFDFSAGSFYPPTVLAAASSGRDVRGEAEHTMRRSEIFREEVFGPVVTVQPFEDDAHALELANDCQYGLGASIWTGDLARAQRMTPHLAAGVVWVSCHHRNDPSSPWGGLSALGGSSSASGMGRENGREALAAYTASQSVTLNLAGDETRRSSEDWFAFVEGRTAGTRYG